MAAHASTSAASKIQAFLGAARIVVVGASADRAKFGNKVLRCYLQHGRTAIPVNPKEASIEGQKCVPSLSVIEGGGGEVAVSIITPPKVTLTVLEEAARLGIARLWLQPGCEDGSVLAKAKELGLDATMIYGGPCVLVHLGYDDAYRPPPPSASGPGAKPKRVNNTIMLLLGGGGGGGGKKRKSGGGGSSSSSSSQRDKHASTKKRPLPAHIPHLPFPSPSHTHDRGGINDTANKRNKIKRPRAQQPRGGKKGREEDTLICPPWIVVPAAERDILVDRVRKEVAPLLGGGGRPGLGVGVEEEEEKEKGEGDGRGKRRRRRRRGKGKEERAKLFSAKEGTPAQRLARALLAVGLNEATRALERSELSLLLLCRDVKPLALLEPAATLCHLRHTPFFVLPKATGALGAALGLKRVAALGFKRLAGNANASVEGVGGGGGGGGVSGDGEGLGGVRARVASFLDFVLAKREFITNAAPAVAPKEEG